MDNDYSKEKQFFCKRVAFKTAPNIDLHFHDCYEIFWFIDGSVKYSVEGNAYYIKQGDILITNMRELHAPIFIDKSRYERCVIQVRPQFLSEFVSDEFNPFAAFENRRSGIGNLIENTFAEEHGLHELMCKIETVSKGERPESTALIKAYMIELLVKLSEITGSKSHVKNAKISAVIKYINENLKNDLSLGALEKSFYISKYYLSHLFKEQTGFTVANYIMQKRIMRSKELIVQGMSLTEAAEAVGFDDYSGFYRSFKRMTGKPPRAFTACLK